MNDKNLILMVVLTIGLMYFYNVYYEWRFGAYLQMQEQLQELQADDKSVEEVPANDEPSSMPDVAATVADAVDAPADLSPGVEAATKSPETTVDFVATTETVAERTVLVDTGVARIKLSNRGASPISFVLEGYFDERHEFVDLAFDLDKFQQTRLDDGADLAKVEASLIPALGLRFPRQAFSQKVNHSYYQVSTDADFLSAVDEPVSISFVLNDSTGVTVEKRYTFYPGKYEFDFAVRVISTPQWGAFDYSLVWFGLGNEHNDIRTMYSYQGPLLMANGVRIADIPEDDNLTFSYSGDIPWVALTNRYYTVFGMPQVSADQEVTTRYLSDEDFSIEWKLKAKVGSAFNNYRFFVGPKRHSILKQYDNGVFSIIDYGWFDVLAKPLFTVMKFFHDMTGNWGWAIILLTILVKTLLFPLSQKGFRSMKRLQKLQPLMKKIQDSYKDDKEKLNQAMLDLYKEHKVNPLGGCLPMVLQIPIFFALYKVLLESIEMKGAPFILWITDLSVKDPHYVTPLLMGASMFLQQKMTPATGDPVQRKVMMMLPVVFTFLFLSFPAGLVLYWLLNNILTIGQQWIINKDTK